MFKKKYLLFLLFGLFFFLPKNTYATIRCEVSDQNWGVIASGVDDTCRSLPVSYNASIYHITFRLDSPKLRTGYDYDLDMEWWVSSEYSSAINSEYLQTYNTAHLYPITSTLTNTQNMGQFSIRTLRTTGTLTSLSNENVYTIVFHFNNFSHVNYIGYNYLDFEFVGDSGTENAIVNGVTDIINNNNSNTQQIIEAMEDSTAAQQQTNNILNDDNTSASSGAFQDFLDDFESGMSDYGLSTLITSPLRLIQTFTTESCSPLTFPLPFVERNVSLACVKPILRSHFPTFYTLWQMLSTGVIAYAVFINIFSKIHQLTNPFNDRIEVLQL